MGSKGRRCRLSGLLGRASWNRGVIGRTSEAGETKFATMTTVQQFAAATLYALQEAGFGFELALETADHATFHLVDNEHRSIYIDCFYDEFRLWVSRAHGYEYKAGWWEPDAIEGLLARLAKWVEPTSAGAD